ncbi:SMI1/KNR4 family protein [Bacillus pseudomycoides]|nr:SMI1/KNR4 family protein [Bacillus pseudomycoides]PFW95715.1 SMI1/KNR4 family protein [Bacillus pseudomycoides]PFX42067.1 SMI1/KNR4 family protein [Bacillus pseudomycoides]
MLVIQFEYSYKPLVSEDIRNFENKYGVTLPDDYKKFLLHSNGGKPVKRRFKTADGTITTSIMSFFPIAEETESNLQNFYNQYNLGKIVPLNLLPIGIDPADSLICLDIDRDGKIYFCDMDYFEEDNELKDEYVKLVSESFMMFLNNLYTS